MSEKKERLIYIDVLRVLAMFPVITCHFTRSLEYAGVGFVSKILPDIFFSVYLGNFGVAIFFVLSGASLMYTYDGQLDWKLYIKKRFLGILPMYWIAWVLAFLYYFNKNIGFATQVAPWKIIYTVFGVDGYLGWFGPNFYLLGEWFLGCLICLYILFPILKIGVDSFPVQTAVIIAIIYGVCVFCYHGTIPAENFFLVRIPEFAFGMYFVRYRHKIPWWIGVICGALLTATWFVDLSRVNVCFRDTAIGILVVVFIAWICQYIKKENFLTNICKAIGKYSYAVFLVHHVLVMELCYHYTGKIFNRFELVAFYVLYLVLTFLFARALFWLNQQVLSLFKKPAVKI